MIPRPEVVALLWDTDPDFLEHRDGQPLTAEERGRVMSANADELREAATLFAGEVARCDLAELMRSYSIGKATLEEAMLLMPEADQARAGGLLKPIVAANEILGRLQAAELWPPADSGDPGDPASP